MKTAISIPDKLFNMAEHLAKQLKVSRSKLYSKAINQYVNTHKKENITELLNKVYSDDKNTSNIDPDILRLQMNSLQGKKW